MYLTLNLQTRQIARLGYGAEKNLFLANKKIFSPRVRCEDGRPHGQDVDVPVAHPGDLSNQDEGKVSIKSPLMQRQQKKIICTVENPPFVGTAAGQCFFAHSTLSPAQIRQYVEELFLNEFRRLDIKTDPIFGSRLSPKFSAIGEKCYVFARNCSYLFRPQVPDPALKVGCPPRRHSQVALLRIYQC